MDITDLPPTLAWTTSLQFLGDNQQTITVLAQWRHCTQGVSLCAQVVALCAQVVALCGVGIDVLSSISRLELQLRDVHVPFHQKLVHQQNPSDCIIHMTTAVQTLLENIRRRKTRVKCLADISKILQRCRAQSIYFLQLRSYTTRTYTANTGATRDVDTFPITTMITVLALTQLVIDNVLYGADTFPTTPDESELVAVLWMFARDFHARPDILSRMICYNT